MDRKIHLKGFSFEKQSRADRELHAAEADMIYGDSFTRSGEAIREIGNNVTLHFAQLDLTEGGPVRLHLTGRTPLPTTAVTLRLTDAEHAQHTVLMPFARCEEDTEQVFDITVPAGVCDADFVFLPGTQFDFVSFRLEK